MNVATVYIVFDTLCLVIMLMVISRFVTMKGQIVNQKLYFIMILMALLLVAADLLYEFRQAGILPLSTPFLYLINDVYFIAGVLVAAVWFTYTCRLSKFKPFNTQKAVIISYIIPGICAFMTLVSPWTHWIFYFDENDVYCRGYLNPIIIAVPVLYLFFCFLFTFILYLNRRDSESKTLLSTVTAFSFFPLSCIILQAFLFDVPILCIGETLAMLQTFINVIIRERDDLLVQKQKAETSILNQAMQSTVQEYVLIAYLSLDEKKFRLLLPQSDSSDYYDYHSLEQLLIMSEEREALSQNESSIDTFLPVEKIISALSTSNKLSRRYTVNNEIYDALTSNSALWTQIDLSTFFNIIKSAKIRSDKRKYDGEQLPGVPLVLSINAYNSDTEDAVSGTTAILTIRNISKVIEKEQDQQKKIADALKLAEAASQAKADFLARMSHEIRTPINAVLGMNTMILRETTDLQIKEYATNIESSGSLLLTLVNDVLDMSKIESGRMEIVSVEYKLSRIMNDLFNMARSRINDGIVQLKMDVNGNIPENLRGDEVRIRQVVTNLLTNAIKYTEKGTITLSAECTRTGNKSIDLIISVSDTGKGISVENQSLIFNAFQRVDEVNNRNIEGSGLGLSITKSFVEMMHGRIRFESRLGVGSTFTVIIPQEVVNDEVVGDIRKQLLKSVTQNSDNHETFTAPDARILVVDDNKMNLLVISKLLGRTKLQVDKADGGNACIEKLRNNQYDLVFLDHMMPAPDGIETLAIIKKMGLADGIPIVALTANAMSGAKEQYLSYGFDAYLSKPVVVNDLESLLIRLLPKEKVILT